MKGFWGSFENVKKETKKAKGFGENQKEIERVAQYVKEKREAFYKNNNIKER